MNHFREDITHHKYFTSANRAARKAMIIGLFLMFLHEFCGCFTMINYTATIFRESGSEISPGLSAIIVAAVQLIGTIVSMKLVDRAGRKVFSVFQQDFPNKNYRNNIFCDTCAVSLTCIINWIGSQSHRTRYLLIFTCVRYCRSAVFVDCS